MVWSLRRKHPYTEPEHLQYTVTNGLTCHISSLFVGTHPLVHIILVIRGMKMIKRRNTTTALNTTSHENCVRSPATATFILAWGKRAGVWNPVSGNDRCHITPHGLAVWILTTPSRYVNDATDTLEISTILEP
ncbi:conserved hypothetical protein [Trichinella spiralis]|uniref:hypothetical protein n=1 Tax=Trichinella spiralis TaxID=6334 RepID=UPI0001EFC146|nr:conserved hypothetical protein [Trichinella spiralis]